MPCLIRALVHWWSAVLSELQGAKLDREVPWSVPKFSVRGGQGAQLLAYIWLKNQVSYCLASAVIGIGACIT
jgi:hypothetical protein